MTLTDAIQRAVIEAFDPQYLNPLNQAFIFDLDEVLEIVGWDDSANVWRLRRFATEENKLLADTEISSPEIGDPYMALRVGSLYGGSRRMFRWEVEPLPLAVLTPIKERADILTAAGQEEETT